MTNSSCPLGGAHLKRWLLAVAADSGRARLYCCILQGHLNERTAFIFNAAGLATARARIPDDADQRSGLMPE